MFSKLLVHEVAIMIMLTVVTTSSALSLKKSSSRETHTSKAQQSIPTLATCVPVLTVLSACHRCAAVSLPQMFLIYSAQVQVTLSNNHNI